MKKIAVIGASTGQLNLCLTAKSMGLEVICFAWPHGAVCDKVVDRFYPISITATEHIIDICKKERIDGVISNSSDLTALISSYVAEALGLIGTPSHVMKDILNKYWVRKQTQLLDGLSCVTYCKYDSTLNYLFPCVVKPCLGSAKKGVSYVSNIYEFQQAIQYAKNSYQEVLIEKYIEGKEFSVETLSFNGCHHVIQITDKVSSGPPHFVELQHHQPSDIEYLTKHRVLELVPRILDSVHFTNGAAHIEMKTDSNMNLYLIEINPRGGGDEISDKLIQFSTGYDFLKGIIQIALGDFEEPVIKQQGFSGIYYLSSFNPSLMYYYNIQPSPEWLIEKKYDGNVLMASTGNYDRNGYLMYFWNNKITL